MAYEELEVSEALIRLALNKGDYDKTAQDTGVSSRTLKRWAKNGTKKAIPELLERAIERVLSNVPDTLIGTDWAIVLGILIDKWLLINDKPTARTENIIGYLQAIPDNELDDLVNEFRQAAVTPRSTED